MFCRSVLAESEKGLKMLVKKILMHIKSRLYLYVFGDFILALLFGSTFDVRHMNIKPISVAAVFIMLYPMLTGMVVERVKKARGKDYFMEIKKISPGISALGILIIVFFSVAKVSQLVVHRPIIFLLVAGGLSVYYLIQTLLSAGTAKLLGLKYEHGMILILGATASSQAISLALAATMFSSLTVFALSFKPILQVLYIMFLIYGLGPHLKNLLCNAQN